MNHWSLFCAENNGGFLFGIHGDLSIEWSPNVKVCMMSKVRLWTIWNQLEWWKTSIHIGILMSSRKVTVIRGNHNVALRISLWDMWEIFKIYHFILEHPNSLDLLPFIFMLWSFHKKCSFQDSLRHFTMIWRFLWRNELLDDFSWRELHWCIFWKI